MMKRNITKLLVSSVGIYFLYRSCKNMASIEYANSVSNIYEYFSRKYKVKAPSATNRIINKKMERVEEKNEIIEPYVLVNNNPEEISELVFLEVGNYLSRLEH